MLLQQPDAFRHEFFLVPFQESFLVNFILLLVLDYIFPNLMYFQIRHNVQLC